MSNLYSLKICILRNNFEPNFGISFLGHCIGVGVDKVPNKSMLEVIPSFPSPFTVQSPWVACHANTFHYSQQYLDSNWKSCFLACPGEYCLGNVGKIKNLTFRSHHGFFLKNNKFGAVVVLDGIHPLKAERGWNGLHCEQMQNGHKLGLS